jgi:hypothetical protein
MCSLFRVHWTIIALTPPRPWLDCSGCGASRPFRSSNRIRLNANGKRLDAWLIYKCATCDKTWNRPIFERRTVGSIEPAVLEALQTNDANWIRHQAFDLAALQRRSGHIELGDNVELRKTPLGDGPSAGTTLHITMAVPYVTGLRLDRLLATELDLPRGRLKAMHKSGALRITPNQPGMLRRPVRDGCQVILNPWLAGRTK